MKLIDWLTSRTLGGKSVEIKAEDLEKYIDNEQMTEVCALEYFTLVAISLVSAIISNCKFRTCLNGKEVIGEEYYLWNYAPNRNQSAVEFKKEIVDVLFRRNECLIAEARGQIFVADGYFLENDNILKDGIFRDVYKGNLHFDRFKMSDVIYLKLNNRNIMALLASVEKGYENIAKNALENYEKSGGRKGFMKIDSGATNKKYGNKSFNEVYQDLLDNRFKRYFSAKNAVLPLFDGFEYKEQDQESRYTGIATDYVKILNEQAAKVALAFNISPQLLVGNVVGLKEAVNNMLTFCVDPLANTIATGANKTRYGKAVLKGSYMWIDTTSVIHIDLFEVAEKIDKLIASGMTSIDELRSRAAMLELGTEESRKHWITKNYQDIKEAKKGGKEDGKKTGEDGDT